MLKKTLMFDPHRGIRLLDFGIQVPILDTRAQKVWDAIGELEKKIGQQWRINPQRRVLAKKDFEASHSPQFIQRLFSSQIENEIIKTYELINDSGDYNRYDPENAKRPLAELFEELLYDASGTVHACQQGYKEGFCFYLGGGMHHAHVDYGSGFCLFNDIAIAVKHLQQEKQLRTIWIIDVDAHKGDGTAEIFSQDASVKTLSIHMAKGWPLDSDDTANKAYIPSDLDIPVNDGDFTGYTDRLMSGLAELAKSGLPDFVLVVNGSDPYEQDELPSSSLLRLSKEQMLDRDMRLFSYLQRQSIPSTWIMAGGYGRYSWEIYTQFLQEVLSS